MTVSVLLATTGRPDMAEASVRGLIETTAPHDLDVCVAVDADSETVGRLLALDGPALRSGRVEIKIDPCRYYRGCSQAWNDALELAEGDPIVLAADDLVWERGWLDAALACLAGFEGGWGMVGFNDGTWREELSTHYLMSRRFVVEVLGGRVAWPCYRHSFNDAEANERARRAGRYAWCEEARVTHQHWLFGGRAQDETDARNLAAHPDSAMAFAARQVAGFPDDYEAVIA